MPRRVFFLRFVTPVTGTPVTVVDINALAEDARNNLV